MTDKSKFEVTVDITRVYRIPIQADSAEEAEILAKLMLKQPVLQKTYQVDESVPEAVAIEPITGGTHA